MVLSLVLKNNMLSDLTNNMSEKDFSGSAANSFKGCPLQVELGNNSEAEARRFPGDGN